MDLAYYKAITHSGVYPRFELYVHGISQECISKSKLWLAIPRTGCAESDLKPVRFARYRFVDTSVVSRFERIEALIFHSVKDVLFVRYDR